MSVSSAVSAQSAMSFRSVRSDASRASTAGRSQLHWQKYRSNILSPHHIRVLPSTSGESIPESILAYIDIHRSDIGRYSVQRTSFRQQVAAGNGFGASAFFPIDVLPSISAHAQLDRCMVPSYSADALPERMTTKAQSKSDLTAPRPSVGYGFSDDAFAPLELTRIPWHLSCTGTRFQADATVHNADSALHAPFLSFERVFSGNEYGVDLAGNQCAVDGAWSVRALQMLYAAAAGEEVKQKFDSPISFSCCIDNDVALMNYHWVDHAQTYCMAPVIKFDMQRDDDFDQLLLWIDAIQQWAISHLLPEIKRAIGQLSAISSPPQKFVKEHNVEPGDMTAKSHAPLPALTTDYDRLRLHLKDDIHSPSMSSIASWGSPAVDEVMLEKLVFAAKLPQARSVCSDSNIARVRFPPSPIIPLKSSIKSKTELQIQATSDISSTSVPAYEKNPELVLKKRLGHAMDEIGEVQAQMVQLKQEFMGTVSCLQTELAGMRKAMTSMVRKEKVTAPKQRSPLRINAPSSLLHGEAQQDLQKSLKPVITTPTEFRPVPFHQRNTSRKSSGLSNVLTPLDTTVSAVVSVRSPKSADSNRSPTSPQSDIISPTSPEQQYVPQSPDNAPSPSIAPSDAISCISCYSCRQHATLSRTPSPRQQPQILQSLLSYRKNHAVTTILLQIILAFCFVDYLVLLVARLQSPLILEHFKNIIYGLE